MNKLAKRDIFSTSGGKRGHTQGVDINCNIFPHPEGEQFPNLIFADAEGQGEGKGKKYESSLATPILLTSKVVIMNIQVSNRIQLDKLNDLEVLMDTANMVDKKQRKNIFGHLHIVCRDFSGRDADAGNVLMDLEDDDEDTYNCKEEYNKAQERNKKRKKIKKNFESITTWMFPNPLIIGELRPEETGFNKKVDELRTSINNQLKEPKLFDGDSFTASSFATTVEELVSFLWYSLLSFHF
jgi:hypothetical protein